MRLYLTLFSCFITTVIVNAQRYWSDASGWPNQQIPQEDQRVTIAQGDHVILDISPPVLRSLTIQGSLSFAEKDLHLTSGWILVEGLLEIGTASNPYTKKATIELNGPIEDPIDMGGRFLAVTSGSLEIHGSSKTKTSWTQISQSVDAGAQQIEVLNSNDWEVGDEIAIAPSGFEANAYDRVSITAINGRTISFSPALSHGHFGKVLNYGGKEIDCRAEVAMLSRNINITSPPSAVTERYGGHIMVMHGSGPIHVEGVGLRGLGQPGRDARYSFHWHLAEDRAGDYIRNSTVTDALQRGVVIHGTQNVEVSDCVAFNIQNHAFIPAEDGNETGNKFYRNLAMHVQNPAREEFAFPRDNAGGSNQGEHRSSGFRMRNFDNQLVDNHVAGVARGNGFFYDVMSRPRAFRNAEEALTTPIVFTGNAAHAISVPGVNNNAGSNVAMYGQVGHGMGIFIDNFPTDEAQEGLLTFYDFTGYKCDMSAIWSEIDEAEFENLALTDNATAFLTGPSPLRDAVVVGRSENPFGDDNRKLRHGNDRAGYYTIAQGGTKRPIVSGVNYYNMHEGKEKEAAAFIPNYKLSYRENHISNIELHDTRPVWMETRGAKGREPTGATLFDADGSLTGLNTPVLILFESSPLVREDCQWHETWNAYTCPATDYLNIRVRWTNRKRFSVDLLQEDESLVHGTGINEKSARFHESEEVELLIHDYDEPQHTFDLIFSPHAAAGIVHGTVRIPYPFPGTVITNNLGDTIPRLTSINDIRTANQPAYFLNDQDGYIILKAYTMATGEITYHIQSGDQNVSTISPKNIIHDAIDKISLYPNPLTPETKISFIARQSIDLDINIHDVSGRLITPIKTGTFAVDKHEIPLNTPTLHPGVYNVVISNNDQLLSLPLSVQ